MSSTLFPSFQVSGSTEYPICIMYPTFRTGTTNRCIDPTDDPSVDPDGMSLQEPFTGIDDEMNSTEA